MLEEPPDEPPPIEDERPEEPPPMPEAPPDEPLPMLEEPPPIVDEPPEEPPLLALEPPDELPDREDAPPEPEPPEAPPVVAPDDPDEPEPPPIPDEPPPDICACTWKARPAAKRNTRVLTLMRFHLAGFGDDRTAPYGGRRARNCSNWRAPPRCTQPRTGQRVWALQMLLLDGEA